MLDSIKLWVVVGKDKADHLAAIQEVILRNRMRAVLVAMILLGTMLLPLSSQQATPKYQGAIVTSVKEHHEAADTETSARRYDVGLRVGNMAYVVLYTPAYGSRTVEYSVGSQVSVLVGAKTIRFSDIQGNTKDMPILRARRIETKTASQ
jgi:hypothetical protein